MMARPQFTHLLSCLGLAVALAAVTAVPLGCAGRDARENELEQLRRDADLEMGGTPATPGVAAPAAPAAQGLSPTRPGMPAPAWVLSGVATGLSAERYIVGIGSARRVRNDDYMAMATADDRARSEIAKSIRVRVTGEFQSAVELVTRLRGEQAVSNRQSSSVAEQITSVTDLELQGAQVADRWFDPKAETWWSLAVLDRAPAGQTLIEQMQRRLQELTADAKAAGEFDIAGMNFQALSYHNRAVRDAFTLLNYRAQVRAIAPALVPIMPALEEGRLAEILHAAVSARERFRVAVVVDASAVGITVSSEPVRTEVERGLRDLGLNIVRADDGSLTTKQIQGTVVEDMARRFGDAADALVIAGFEARETSVAKLGEMDVHFWRAKGGAMIVDLDAKRVVSSASFDYLPSTHTGLPQAQRAAEGSLLKAAQEMLTLLHKELAAHLALPI